MIVRVGGGPPQFRDDGVRSWQVRVADAEADHVLAGGTGGRDLSLDAGKQVGWDAAEPPGGMEHGASPSLRKAPLALC